MAELQKATNSVSQENTDDPKFQLASAGLYEHPESGEQLAAFYDPVTGDAQAQALVRVGFRRVSDVPKDYDKTVVVNHDFASQSSKGAVVSAEERAGDILAAVRLLQDEKNVAEDQAAKANDNSSDNVDELRTEEVQAKAAEKVDQAADQSSDRVNVAETPVVPENKNKKESK